MSAPKSIQKITAASALTASILCFSTTGLAAGYQLFELGAAGLGYAYAGRAALSEDSSIVFNNPAAMTALSGNSVLLTNHTIKTDFSFKNNGSTHALGGELKGSNDDGGGLSQVPNFYAHYRLNKVDLGLAINAPFGSKTEYDDTWVGRYHAVNSSIKIINFSPVVAYQINDRFAIGGGIDIQSIDVELTNAVDLAAVLGSNAQDQDGFATISGDKVGYGFNIGVFYRQDKLRAGASYHSAITHSIDGKADFSVPGNLRTSFDSLGLFQDTDVKAEATVPAVLTVSAIYELNDLNEVLFDYTWTGWSVFDTLEFDFDNPSQPDAINTYNWRDTYRFALGYGYQYSPKIKWRLGFAFDQSSISDVQHRTPRVPDNDRNWYTAGLQYKHSDQLSFDAAYAYLTLPDTPINNVYESSNASVQHTLKGSYSASAEIFAAQVNWQF